MLRTSADGLRVVRAGIAPGPRPSDERPWAGSVRRSRPAVVSEVRTARPFSISPRRTAARPITERSAFLRVQSASVRAPTSGCQSDHGPLRTVQLSEPERPSTAGAPLPTPAQIRAERCSSAGARRVRGPAQRPRPRAADDGHRPRLGEALGRRTQRKPVPGELTPSLSPINSGGYGIWRSFAPVLHDSSANCAPALMGPPLERGRCKPARCGSTHRAPEKRRRTI